MPEQQLNKLIPHNPEFTGYTMNANRDLPFHDYWEPDIWNTPESYPVGKNNRDAHGDQRKLFVSKSTLIYTDVDAWVQFNSTENIEIFILAKTWYEFKSNIYQVTIWTHGEQVEGQAYIYFEGTMPAEARSPE